MNPPAAGLRLDLSLGTGVGPHIGIPGFSEEKCTLLELVNEEGWFTLTYGPRSATRSCDLLTLAAGKASSFFCSS